MSSVEILSPFTGKTLPIEQVPDVVFAEKFMGDGIAVEPTVGSAVAPIGGEVIISHSSGHAFVIENKEHGFSVLIHIGLDTVKMQGNGFTVKTKVGDLVKAGDELVTFDLAAISAAGYSAISPVIIPDMPDNLTLSKSKTQEVTAGGSILFTVTIEA